MPGLYPTGGYRRGAMSYRMPGIGFQHAGNVPFGSEGFASNLQRSGLSNFPVNWWHQVPANKSPFPDKLPNRGSSGIPAIAQAAVGAAVRQSPLARAAWAALKAADLINSLPRPGDLDLQDPRTLFFGSTGVGWVQTHQCVETGTGDYHFHQSPMHAGICSPGAYGMNGPTLDSSWDSFSVWQEVSPGSPFKYHLSGWIKVDPNGSPAAWPMNAVVAVPAAFPLAWPQQRPSRNPFERKSEEPRQASWPRLAVRRAPRKDEFEPGKVLALPAFGRALASTLANLSEVNDMLQALVDAIPKRYHVCSAGTISCRFLNLQHAWQHIDWAQALKNALVNEAVDRTVAKGLSRRFHRPDGSRHWGPAVGPQF